MKVRKRTVFGLITLFSLGLVIIIQLADSVVKLVDERFKNNAEDELREKILLAKTNLESELFRDVFLVDSLATVFNIDPHEAVTNFTEISQRLLDKSDNVRNVGIAPNDVITNVNPLATNERAIGLDFRTVPEQYATVVAARERQDIYLAGPVNLVQGGRGLIARIPVFNDYPVNSDYWGTVSVVIDYQQLMMDAGLLSIENTKVGLRGINGEGQAGGIIEGEEQLFANPDYEGKLIIPNGEWWVAATFSPQLTQSQQLSLHLVRWGIILIYVLLFGIITLLWAFYRAERQRANEDVLTRMVNRRYALNHLQQLFSNRSKADRFCVIVIDLNYFKSINDSFGHDIGDKVLQVVAQRLRNAVRGSDVVARMGGDEFLVVANRIKDPRFIDRVVEKIRTAVEGTEFSIEELPFKASLSIGVACSSEKVKSVEHLLKLADTRMYENKEAIRASHGAEA